MILGWSTTVTTKYHDLANGMHVHIMQCNAMINEVEIANVKTINLTFWKVLSLGCRASFSELRYRL
jgi:hypothetical protein